MIARAAVDGDMIARAAIDGEMIARAAIDGKMIARAAIDGDIKRYDRADARSRARDSCCSDVPMVVFAVSSIGILFPIAIPFFVTEVLARR